MGLTWNVPVTSVTLTIHGSRTILDLSATHEQGNPMDAVVNPQEVTITVDLADAKLLQEALQYKRYEWERGENLQGIALCSFVDFVVARAGR